MPVLISRIVRSAGGGVALLDDARQRAAASGRCGRSRRGRPDRRSPRPAAAVPARRVSSSARGSRLVSERHVARQQHARVPAGLSRTRSACSSAWPVPSCGSCTTKRSVVGARRATRATSSAPWPTTTVIDCGRSDAAAAGARARSAAGRRPGAAPWAVPDFIRVPLPAARTTTWRSSVDRRCAPLRFELRDPVSVLAASHVSSCLRWTMS